MINLSELEKLAREATPDGRTERGSATYNARAAFIAAANPETVLALVRVARAAARLRTCDGDITVLECNHDDLDDALAALKDPSK